MGTCTMRRAKSSAACSTSTTSIADVSASSLFYLFMQRHRNHDRQPQLEHHGRGSNTVGSSKSPTSKPIATFDGIVEDDRIGQAGAEASKIGVPKSDNESGDRNGSLDGSLPKNSVYHMHKNNSSTSAASPPGSGEVIGPLLPSLTALAPHL